MIKYYYMVDFKKNRYASPVHKVEGGQLYFYNHCEEWKPSYHYNLSDYEFKRVSKSYIDKIILVGKLIR
jgi:hypothetical protein